MATSLRFATLDVFTTERYKGNPLGLVHLPAHISLTQAQKQSIAREFNLSETVFLHDGSRPSPNAVPEWTVDIFLTSAEIPFAGHPTIGTACYVLSAMAKSRTDANKHESTVEAAFNIKAGRIELSYNIESEVASASIPHNVHVHGTQLSFTELATFHPELKAAVSSFEEVKPAPVVSIVKGMTFALPEMQSLEHLAVPQLATRSPDNKLLDGGWDESFFGVFFYVRLPDQGDGVERVRARMIGRRLEDPATGSASSALASYLTLQNGKPGQTVRYLIIQGVEMGRESKIGVEVTLANSEERKIEKVVLSGSAVQVMKGDLVI